MSENTKFMLYLYFVLRLKMLNSLSFKNGEFKISRDMELPELNEMKRIILATRDTHELYRKYGGFQNMVSRKKWMERIYSK